MSRRRGVAGLVACALVATTGLAEAKPRKRNAKAAFDRGLAAYKKASYTAASEALSQSYSLERDPDTLFAWAQAERKLEHCDKALELYDTLLGQKLPAKNREAVERSVADCRAVIAAQQPPPPPEPPPPVEAPPPPVVVAPPPAPPPPPAPSPTWYRDPIPLELIGLGVIATGVGTGFLISAHSLNDQAHSATQIDDARRLGEQANSRGNVGLIALGAGGALVAGGVVWILAHRHDTEPSKVAGWLAPGGGGLAVSGAF